MILFSILFGRPKSIKLNSGLSKAKINIAENINNKITNSRNIFSL